MTTERLTRRTTAVTLRQIEEMALWAVAGLAISVALGTVGALLLKFVDWGRVGAAVLPAGDKASWYLTRATATVAYLLLSGATAWGLVLSTKIVKAAVPAPLALALHGGLSWLGLVLGGAHAALLLMVTYYVYTPAAILVPFTGPYRPLWVGLGTLSLYGLLVVSASFWARKWLGMRAWRMLHYTTFVFYVLVTLHGIMAGTDSHSSGAQAMYVGSALLVSFLTAYRVLTTTPAPRPA